MLNCLASEVGSVIDKETAMSHAEGEDFGNAWLSTNGAGSVPTPWARGGRTSGATGRQSRLLAGRADDGPGDRAARPGKQRPAAAAGAGRCRRGAQPDATDVEGVAGNERLKVLDELRGRILYMGLSQKDPLLSRPEMVEAMKYLIDYAGMESSFLKGQ